jgi:hypothetical protein
VQRHAPAGLEFAVELRQRVAHVHGAARRAQRVVLVQVRVAEDGHDRVADVLLDLPAVALDRLVHGREVAPHDAVQRFRVQALGERREAGQVAVQGRDRLAGEGGRVGRQANPACRAEPRVGGIGGAAR